MAGPSAEVAIVGGGPAGAALAIRLADAGHEVVVFERRRRPVWRACGVYSSPRTPGRLRELGLTTEAVASLARPIPGMVVETTAGTRCRLEYQEPGPAVGLDRPRLDAQLLVRAAAAGATVRDGTIVRAARPSLDPRSWGSLEVSAAGAREVWRARLIVGADGPGSLVARAAGVSRSAGSFRRAGVTLHLAEPATGGGEGGASPADAHMIVGTGWYCGLAPVPRGRVNAGIVVDGTRLPPRDEGGASAVVRDTLAQLPASVGGWRDAPWTDQPSVAMPLLHRVRRRAGPGFLLVGDAAGFIDPFSGEGIHRALVSVEMAADAIGSWSRGSLGAADAYDRRLRSRFRAKDLLSWVLQLLLARPELIEYAVRRLRGRDAQRRTFARVLADLEPPRHAFEPGFLMRLLAP